MDPPPSSISAGCDNTAWNGKQLFVWGNHTEDENSPFSGGAIYDAAEGKWEEIPTDGAPAFRSLPQLFADSEHLVVWGGRIRHTDTFLRDGGVFDLRSRHRTRIDASLMPPSYDAQVTAIPSGQLFFWGTYDPFAVPQALVASLLALDTGRLVTSAPADLPPVSAKMLVRTTLRHDVLMYGGWCNKGGGFYSPTSGQWSSIPKENAPLNLRDQSEVWTGTSIITWGGREHYCGGTVEKSNTGVIFTRPD